MKSNKEKTIIGYTTGVFDLFHIGHLNILKKAKSQCDFLIVGVATDSLTLKLKGSKPVIGFGERIKIVENIKFVDRVVSQKIVDEIGDYNKYKFRVILKGDDWKKTEKWRKLGHEFTKLGVKVVFFPYTKTTSSTLIKKFLDLNTKK